MGETSRSMRFQPKTSSTLFVFMVSSAAAVFVADVLTPLGVAVWVFYLVPMMLCLFAWEPPTPVLTALVVALLMMLGFVLSPPGISKEVAVVNRALGLITVGIIAAVARIFIRNKLALRKQEWLQTGKSSLADRIRGDQRLEQLGSNVLKFFAEYLHAQVGVVFTRDKDGFERTASYALPIESPTPLRFTLKDGLLGQAASDGRVFLLGDVPQEYLTVGSALGQSPPRHLLIAPLMHEGGVQAVVELGFMHEVHRSDRELLEQVATPIAVAVASSLFRTKLQLLLEETQQQAEELQAQSEELRVNNEELDEQSRALQASQTRLERQQAKLEETNERLSEQAKLLEEQRDELSRAQADLEQRAHQLEEASRYKSEFLANMSHELRTPLNSSLIMAKLLADNPHGTLTEEQVRYAETIGAAGADLLNLINDILDLSKIEAGRVEVHVEHVRLGRVAEDLDRLFRASAEQKSLRFAVTVAPEAPDTIETDGQRLEQVLKNLIANALKFTERGEVSLRVEAAAHERVRFAVRDTGIGIAPQQREIIFEAFRQADGTTNRKYGGTGLGLSISRELVRLLGGEIALESEPDRGSTFTVTVPVRYEPRAQEAARAKAAPVTLPPASSELAPSRPNRKEPSSNGAEAPETRVHPRRFEDDRVHLTQGARSILVVEDDETFARVLAELAHEQRFQCLVASSAEEALMLAVQYRPSAVVLDVGLPDNSGLSVLDRLKRDARTRHIPVHVVSGGDYAEAALSLGAVGYMLKPVRREELIRALEQLETKFTQRLRRVLVVEDDDAQRESIRALLGSRQVETVGVRSASECLERLHGETFDSMVLDLSLPDDSGFALLEKLSLEDKYSFPPVIVYTGKDLSSDDEQRLRRFSKSIIIKGAKSPERLLDEVSLFLHQVVAELPPEHQRMLQKAQSRDEALESKRILVVEDDVRNVFALTSILEPHGAKVLIARNGREALEVLERQDRLGAPVDLALMDVMMPEMDGLAATRAIRKRLEWKKLPIIALTAKAMKNDQEECIGAGANDYMAKPLDVEKLLSLVRVWMPR